jgi:hypothetical protein
VLTLRPQDGDEYVWGVRILGAGPLDPALGFEVGSDRHSVIALWPNAITSDERSLTQALDDGTLIVTFSEDEVTEIQLLAPLEFQESS